MIRQPLFFNSIDLIIKIIAVILFAGWQLYWRIMAISSNKAKLKTQKMSWFDYIKMSVTWFFGLFLFIQLIGFRILPFQYSLPVQIIGLLLVIIGISISCSARITLEHNWTPAYEYQIKKNHELVTSSIYSYIRHPIYTGLILAYTGGELILNSYLFIPIFITINTFAYIQGRNVLSVYFLR